MTSPRLPATLGLHGRRMRLFAEAGLYLATSAEFSRGRSSLDIVRKAVAGGVRLVQLREKHMCGRDLLRLAEELRRVTARAGALFIVNDRLDIALACGADGVHLGGEDLPVAAARRIAPGLIIGASAGNAAEVRKAQSAGASYVNIGPVFPTGTKAFSPGEYLGLDGVKKVCTAATIPFTVMGGIRKEHIAGLVAAGAAAIAVITAVTAADNPREAAAGLLAEIGRARKTTRGAAARVAGGSAGARP